MPGEIRRAARRLRRTVSVSARPPEIGIRMALGAAPGQVAPLALVAAWRPGRRALRVEPITVLREG